MRITSLTEKRNLYRECAKRTLSLKMSWSLLSREEGKGVEGKKKGERLDVKRKQRQNLCHIED